MIHTLYVSCALWYQLFLIYLVNQPGEINFWSSEKLLDCEQDLSMVFSGYDSINLRRPSEADELFTI